MGLGANTSGWTVLDSGDGRSMCAVSVRCAARGGQRPRVLAAVEVACADAQAEPDALRGLMGQVERRLPLLCTLSRSQYRLRVMAEPAVPARELLQSLRWALSTEGDTPQEEHNLAWLPIPAQEQAPSRGRQGYVVSTPSEALDARLATWRAAGVRPKVVDIRETALRNLAGAVEPPGQSVALLSAEAAGVAMVFTHQGALVLDRFAELAAEEPGAADPAAHERQQERIATQLQRSLDVLGHAYPGLPPASVLAGPAPRWPELGTFLSARLAQPVLPFALEQVFDLTEVPHLAQSAALQARCMVALGAALRGMREAA
ncbi:type IV pilus biogenesis protein PilM [Azohydromonas lata]|uniref:type IV pilus biogenesis protein PilM n=1 Tax=Azohydromonas lata TaxID=45677 RepID=UPI0012F4FFC1|nr:hypothetical protein [Azohydromonas lata]